MQNKKNTDFLIQSVAPGEQYSRLAINENCCNIIAKDTENNICQACGMMLQSCTTPIPLKAKGQKFESVSGMRCRHCKTLYIRSEFGEKIRKLLTGNYYAKKFTFNGESIWQYSATQNWGSWRLAEERQRAQQEMTQYASAFCTVILEHYGKLKNYIIVQKKTDIDEGKTIHCRDPFALELLAAGLVASKKRIAKYEGNTYRVIGIVKNSRMRKQDRSFFITNDVKVVLRDSWEWSLDVTPRIVFIAMFSPHTNRYEYAEGRLGQLDGAIYMEPDALYQYVSKYGKPEARLRGIGKGSGYFEFDLLPEKSILNMFGYEVNQMSSKSEQDRQKLLSILMDADLVQKEKILRHINWLIGSRSSEKYYTARLKWQADMEFVENYVVNKERYARKS